MDELSKLLREARPLYFARRRRRKMAAFGATLAVFIAIVNISGFFRQPPPFYELWTETLSVSESGSCIENMGLPVDNYGLLMVG